MTALVTILSDPWTQNEGIESNRRLFTINAIPKQLIGYDSSFALLGRTLEETLCVDVFSSGEAAWQAAVLASAKP